MEYQMEGIDAFCILLPYYCILKNNSQKESRSGLKSGRNGVDPSGFRFTIINRIYNSIG